MEKIDNTSTIMKENILKMKYEDLSKILNNNSRLISYKSFFNYKNCYKMNKDDKKFYFKSTISNYKYNIIPNPETIYFYVKRDKFMEEYYLKDENEGFILAGDSLLNIMIDEPIKCRQYFAINMCKDKFVKKSLEIYRKIIDVYDNINLYKVFDYFIITNNGDFTIQLINSNKTNPLQLLDSFDIDLCSVYYNGEKIYLTESAAICLSLKIIIYKNNYSSNIYSKRIIDYVMVKGFELIIEGDFKNGKYRIGNNIHDCKVINDSLIIIPEKSNIIMIDKKYNICINDYPAYEYDNIENLMIHNMEMYMNQNKKFSENYAENYFNEGLIIPSFEIFYNFHLENGLFIEKNGLLEMELEKYKKMLLFFNDKKETSETFDDPFKYYKPPSIENTEHHRL